jgi:hypothetical protein
MEAYSFGIAILGYILGGVLILRAARGEFLSRFVLFYSYVAYVLCGSAMANLVSWLRPEYYASTFWYYFLVGLLAEFAVVVEISDHLFAPYPAIQRLGRFLAVFICSALFLFYIFPSLTGADSLSLALLDFIKRATLTKALIVIAILAAARYYRLPLGKNVSGLIAGFGIYLGVTIANFSLAEVYGRAIYGRTFSVVGPLASTLCLLVWTVSLWRYQPVAPIHRSVLDGNAENPEPMDYQLTRLHTTLARLLRK